MRYRWMGWILKCAPISEKMRHLRSCGCADDVCNGDTVVGCGVMLHISSG